MNDGQLLLRAVLDHPHDDTARLVYADWLDEQGRGARAEFIKCQVSRNLIPHPPRSHDDSDHTNRGSTSCPRCLWYAEYADLRAGLVSKCTQLITKHAVEWFPLATWVPRQFGKRSWARHHLTYWAQGSEFPGAGEVVVHRGFVSEVSCLSSVWASHGDIILNSNPVTKVVLTDVPEFAADSPFRVSFGGRLGAVLAGKSLGLEIPEGEDAAKAFLEARWPGVEFELPAPADWQV